MTATTIEVRPVGAEELPIWAALNHRGFLSTTRPSEARLKHYQRQSAEYRFWLAYSGSTPCGAYRSWDLELPVPGAAAVPTRAIGSLSVLATHRRRGVASSFVRGALSGARERGAALSLLIPSESGIYGRFGFGAATETTHLAVDTRRITLPPAEGLELELTDDAAVRAVAPALYREVAAGMPGALPRTDLWWDDVCGLHADEDDDDDRPAVIARDQSGAVVGTASYRIKGDWSLDHQADIELQDLTAANPAAYTALWRFLADLDLTDRVLAEDRPVHEPLAWMLPDRRAITESHRTDFQWVRVLDVVAALSARAAQGPGRVVVEVADADGYANGRWLVDADEDGRTQVTATEVEAEVTLPVQTLGSLYLGQNSLVRLHGAGRADEHRAGAVRRLDRMLAWAPEAAVGHTWF
ncbi:UPF0256 protein [Kineosporia sp. NBRC 101677]|uniref:GNAT family N-acetyltransferase n=1 Tax=Kineosporia sp. NBRC 101677 TaxID=3032197 RepID=UPI0024A2C863|nr:GNAT family N-acetyltransferase [Kineosporia sp. NBRC 101677]GLY13805.1 UPF0256 protein [Kineosporia sp. NBRC 101677]